MLKAGRELKEKHNSQFMFEMIGISFCAQAGEQYIQNLQKHYMKRIDPNAFAMTNEQAFLAFDQLQRQVASG